MWSEWRSEKPTRLCSLGGYLWKMKRKYKFHLPQWNKRWFSIEGKYLRWYAKEDSPEKSGEVLLSKIKSINKFENSGGVFSFIVQADERSLFLRADSLKTMEKWFRAIEMQADYARGGDGTSMISNATKPTPPKRRIRQSHSLLDELNKAARELNDLEKKNDYDHVEDELDPLETSTGTESGDIVVTLGEEPEPPEDSRVRVISSKVYNPRLEESLEDSLDSIDHDIPVRIRQPSAGGGPRRPSGSSSSGGGGGGRRPSGGSSGKNSGKENHRDYEIEVKYEEEDISFRSGRNSLREPSPRSGVPKTKTQGWM